MLKRAESVLIAGLLALFLCGTVSIFAATRLPSRFVPGDDTISAAIEDQTAPFLAAGNGMVLAVWSDNRANTTLSYEGETSQDILGVRLDEDGVFLDSVPFAIAARPAGQSAPKAAWNGTHWLVVYQGQALGGTGLYYQNALQAVRVAPDGSVVDARPIDMYGVTPSTGYWDVASDGSNWVIAFQGNSTGNDTYALRISAAGVVLDPPTRTLLSASGFTPSNLRLAHAGSVFLLTYTENGTTSAVRFDSDLTRLDADSLQLVGGPLHAFASSGSQFYGIWSDTTNALLGTRIDTAGQVLDSGGDNVSGANTQGAFATSSVTWDGSNWKVTWGSGGSLRVARVDNAGNVLDPGGVAVTGPETGQTASAGNESVQLVWAPFADNNYDVNTANVSAGNSAGPNRTLSVGAPGHGRSDVATSGNGYLMVYRSSTSAVNRVLAQPLDAAGNPLLAEPVELDAGDYQTGPGSPSVAWNGSLYLVSWGNGSGVVGQRFQPDGTPIDPSPFVVMNPGFGRPSVAALADDFLVVGRRCGTTCQNIGPIAARVRGSDGVVLDTPPIGLAGVFSSYVKVAVLGGKWFVVWRNNASHDDSFADTKGVFIDANGVKEPEFTVHGPYSSTGGNSIFTNALAANGSVALMVQSQELTSGVETDLLGRLIHADGTVEPMINLTPWRGNQYRPSVAWDGSQFILVFQDQKTRFANLEQLDARSDLFGMRITETGAILDPQGFVFSNSPYGEAFPDVAASNGTTLIAGSVLRNAAPWANYRLGYDLFGADGNAWPIAVASADPTGGDVPLIVDFDSLGSGDPAGAVAGYDWDFGDGQSSTEAAPTHTYTAAGPYVATLTVTDNGSAQSMQTVLVQATEPNIPPVAVASANVTSGAAPLSVTFFAAGSYDPDGSVGNVNWNFGDGAQYWGSTAYHTFSQPGVWQVTLTVYDSRGATGTDTLTISVGPPLVPDPPSGLSAVTISTSWINLSWSDNSINEVGFKVERCLGFGATCAAGSTAWAQIAQTGVNAEFLIDNTGLLPATTYSYRVRAFNATGDSAWSNTVAAMTQGFVPEAPTNLTATAGKTTGRGKLSFIDLAWVDNSPDESGFVIERCAGRTCTNFAPSAFVPADATSYHDRPVARRTYYRYRVKASAVGAESAYSNIVTIRSR